MTLYRRPAFWALLLMWQAFAFLAATCLATACYLAASELHGPLEPRHLRMITWFARTTHLLLAILGFLLAKRRMQHSPPPPPTGFPVIPRSNHT